jgi:membrane protease YdiL (CAAX protease family)
MVLSYTVMRLAGTVPASQIEALPTFTLCTIFFVSALGEELGWSGYVIDPMQHYWNALQASVVLGFVWAIWHFVPLLQAHRSLPWIAWWSLGTVASRVIIVWLYNNAGKSVFAATLSHATLDVSWQLFPIHGSFYDPRITGVITAIAAAIITVVWRPATLVRDRNT